MSGPIVTMPELSQIWHEHPSHQRWHTYFQSWNRPKMLVAIQYCREGQLFDGHPDEQVGESEPAREEEL